MFPIEVYEYANFSKNVFFGVLIDTEETKSLLKTSLSVPIFPKRKTKICNHTKTKTKKIKPEIVYDKETVQIFGFQEWSTVKILGVVFDEYSLELGAGNEGCDKKNYILFKKH